MMPRDVVQECLDTTDLSKGGSVPNSSFLGWALSFPRGACSREQKLAPVQAGRVEWESSGRRSGGGYGNPPYSTTTRGRAVDVFPLSFPGGRESTLATCHPRAGRNQIVRPRWIPAEAGIGQQLFPAALPSELTISLWQRASWPYACIDNRSATSYNLARTRAAHQAS